MFSFRAKGNWENSKRIEVTDIRKLLLEDVSYLPSEFLGIYGIIGPYGIAYHLKNYAGINQDILLNKCSFEHGPYFLNMVCHMEVTHHASCILTYSPFREEVIKELTDINPIAIGPYIAYADEYRSRESIKKLKKKLGRVLLVMPSHSTVKESVEYDIEEFICQIERNKKDFDRVIVCMHFEDLKKGLWKRYEQKGYYIVSAGNILSPYFLSRTKYIFELADALIVNTVTTGMAFAMYMQIPIKLIRQKVNYNLCSRSNINELELENLIDKAYELFDNSEFSLSKEQKKFGNYVFGLENVKSKEEMKILLMSLTRMDE